jgi:purine-binding chemotaxis protein CheW
MIEKGKQINSYLSFKLGNEDFALHVSKVLNILEKTNITEVPKSPDYMKGVINLRGTVLPVIDTRIKFGLTETKFTDKTCIIVMELTVDNQTILIGSLVDEVLSVLEIESNEIQEAPSIGNNYRAEFVTGMVEVDDKFIMILDMETLYSLNELVELKNKTKNELELEKQ